MAALMVMQQPVVHRGTEEQGCPRTFLRHRTHCPLYQLPFELAAECLEFLAAEDLLQAELISRSIRAIIQRFSTWRKIFVRHCQQFDWRQPLRAPTSWKAFYFQYRSEAALRTAERVPGMSTTVYWRILLPKNARGFKQRSREFPFARDALGGNMEWQFEVELQPGVPVYPHLPHAHLPHPPPFLALAPRSTSPTSPTDTPTTAPPFPNHSCPSVSTSVASMPHDDATVQHYHQTGLVRIWTTNKWTNETAKHYFGSHCTVSMRDSFNTKDLHPEVFMDLDNGHQLEFDACLLPSTRELLLKVNLTLALEVPVPMHPFYSLISSSSPDSDLVKVGYCRALFEIARAKRKLGGPFVKECDRSISSLTELASSSSTSEKLRVEVFKALFNLLGPTAIYLPQYQVDDVLNSCFQVIRLSPIPALEASAAHGMIQNALGSVFNLLVHPSSKRLIRPHLHSIFRLLDDSSYRLCHFSVIAVLLTAHTWGVVPEELVEGLTQATLEYIHSKDPLDSDCTGVTWDETDIAAYFLPLLMSRQLICVRFASWCLGMYYFPPQAHPQ